MVKGDRRLGIEGTIYSDLSRRHGNSHRSHGKSKNTCGQEDNEDGADQIKEEEDGLMAHGGEAKHAYIDMMKMVSIKSRRKAKASSLDGGWTQNDIDESHLAGCARGFPDLVLKIRAWIVWWFGPQN
jgi:hypothetical protein